MKEFKLLMSVRVGLGYHVLIVTVISYMILESYSIFILLFLLVIVVHLLRVVMGGE